MAFEKITSLIPFLKKSEDAGVPKKAEESKNEEIAPEVRAQAQAIELALAAVSEYERRKKRTFRKKAFWTSLVVVVATAALLNWSGAGNGEYQYKISKTTLRSFTAAGLAGTSGGVLATSAIPVAVGGGGKGSIAFIPIRGEIGGSLYDPPDPENTVLYLAQALELAKKSAPNLAGVVLYIDSPGGGAIASAHGYRLIKEFRREAKVPVIAFAPGWTASGGYYFALGADRIIIDPDASLGSIGVIMGSLNKHGLGSLVGLRQNNIVSGLHKDAFAEWKEINEADQVMMQFGIDQTFERFIAAVSESRGIPLADLKKEAHELMGRSSGAWFSADDAVAKKLADAKMTGEELFQAFASDLVRQKGYSDIEILRFERQLAPEEKEAKKVQAYASAFAEVFFREISRSRMELRAE